MLKKGAIIKMAISLRLTEQETKLFKNYAKLNGITISELVRQSVLERIESECDLQAYQKAILNYKSNPVTYSLDEVEEMLGLK